MGIPLTEQFIITIAVRTIYHNNRVVCVSLMDVTRSVAVLHLARNKIGGHGTSLILDCVGIRDLDLSATEKRKKRERKRKNETKKREKKRKCQCAINLIS